MHHTELNTLIATRRGYDDLVWCGYHVILDVYSTTFFSLPPRGEDVTTRQRSRQYSLSNMKLGYDRHCNVFPTWLLHTKSSCDSLSTHEILKHSIMVKAWFGSMHRFQIDHYNIGFKINTEQLKACGMWSLINKFRFTRFSATYKIYVNVYKHEIRKHLSWNFIKYQ